MAGTQITPSRRSAANDASTTSAFYDLLGEWSLRLQEQEHSDGLSRQTVEFGRRVHRQWVEEVFAPQLAGRRDREETRGPTRGRHRRAHLEILRRDGGMDRSTTCKRMLRLVRALLPTPSERS